MDKNAHTQEQGYRVHYLANLGGLIALAGLDREPPDFLLGALLRVAREAAALTVTQRGEIAATGQIKLDERATGKRAWTSWRRASELHAMTFTSDQVRHLLTALRVSIPQDSAGLEPALVEALRKSATNGR